MHMRLLTYLVLFAFGLSTFLGLYVAAGHQGHDAHCPFVQVESSLCATVLDHIDHWQVAFAAVLVALLICTLVGTAVLHALPLFLTPKRVRFREDPESRAPDRPTLYQELFARGILNPRAP